MYYKHTQHYENLWQTVLYILLYTQENHLIYDLTSFFVPLIKEINSNYKGSE